MPSLKQYVETYKAIADQVQAQTGVPAVLALAQSALESRRGDSWLSSRFNNFFGVKAGSGWGGALAPLKTREVDRSGQEYFVVQNFRAYPSPLAGWLDWAQVARRIAKDPQSSDPNVWAAALARGGYATDPNYESVLKSTIRQVQAVLMAQVSGADLAALRRALNG